VIEVITVPEMSNREFLEQYAKPGYIGLAGGDTLIDRVIRRAERHVSAGQWSNWSHAFLFSERRVDGHLWVIESDLAAARRHIRFGVQENRVSKYFNQKLYGNLAILDLGLSDEKARDLVSAGLDLVATSTRYSVRELFGTLLALRSQKMRSRDNVLSRDQCFYCSALVQHLFCKIGMDLCPGIHAKNCTPEDIFQNATSKAAYVLDRKLGTSKFRAFTQRIGQRKKNKKES
jgi:hypothetical protein